MQLFQKYVLGVPEDVKSSFQQRDLPTWTLRLLSQVRGVRATEVPGLLVNTFGGYSASRANPQWIAIVEAEVATLIVASIASGTGRAKKRSRSSDLAWACLWFFIPVVRVEPTPGRVDEAAECGADIAGEGSGDDPGLGRDGCHLHAGHETGALNSCSDSPR